MRTRKKHTNPNCQCASCKSKRGEYIGNKASNYKDGRSSKVYYCKCGRKVHNITALYGTGRCYKCGIKERKTLKGKNHPFYVHGLGHKPYTPEFTITLKERIKKRDNYKCQNCEMTQEEHLIVWGRDIEIHHIDYDKENCKEDNLITLCKQCNMRANKNRSYWEKHFNSIIKVKTVTIE